MANKKMYQKVKLRRLFLWSPGLSTHTNTYKTSVYCAKLYACLTCFCMFLVGIF